MKPSMSKLLQLSGLLRKILLHWSGEDPFDDALVKEDLLSIHSKALGCEYTVPLFLTSLCG